MFNNMICAMNKCFFLCGRLLKYRALKNKLNDDADQLSPLAQKNVNSFLSSITLCRHVLWYAHDMNIHKSEASTSLQHHK